MEIRDFGEEIHAVSNVKCEMKRKTFLSPLSSHLLRYIQTYLLT